MAKAFNKGSYTNYSNKIGLYSKLKGSFISNSRDVVLNFPYKDCVLVGGMTKEDAKRDEKFLNGDALLANNDINDIDVLLDPKVFTNFKYVSGGGERSLSANDDIEFFDEDGELKQNLLIKGNNLIALYSLYPRLAGKVKLIYIDPPYNTGNDGFKYNDSFNHSAWLTFMKNRLEIARQLLRDDGAIVCNIDYNEQAYLKVLMDEIFGRGNCTCCIPRITKMGGKSSEAIAKNHDYLLLYARNSTEQGIFHPIAHDDDGFSNRDDYFSSRGYYKLNQTLDYDSLQYSSNMDYPLKLNDSIFYPGGDRDGFIKRHNGVHKDHDWVWRWSKAKVDFGYRNGFIVIKHGPNGDRLYTKTYQHATISRDAGGYFVDQIKRTKPLSTLEFIKSEYSNDSVVGEQRKVFGDNIFNYAKPEKLLETIIELCTAPGDLVLDYHLGSGTTAAVAHKMGRRWIGIEQMDYIETIAKKRLEKVIAGEQGGISKSVGWQGGGDFVYMELKKYNQDYVDRIWAAQTYGELDAIKDEMLQNAFLKFWFTKADFDAKWRDGEINARKVELINQLDANQLYLNYADMDDDKYKVSDDDKVLTKRFYGPDEDDNEEMNADVDIDDIVDDGDGMETSGE